VSDFVLKKEELRPLIERVVNSQELGLDYETTSVHPSEEAPKHHDKLMATGFGVAFSDGYRKYVPMMHVDSECFTREEVDSLLRAILMDKDKQVWAHNAKFEQMVSRSLGYDSEAAWRCSMLLQFGVGWKLPGNDGLKLKSAVKHYLNHDMKLLKDVIPLGLRAHDIPARNIADYCSDDAFQCLRLGHKAMERAEELNVVKPFIDLECAFTPVLVHMLEVGIGLDQSMLDEMHIRLKTRVDEISELFLQLTGAEVGSNKQVSKRLYEELKWWPSHGFKKGKGGCYSVDVGHREKVRKWLRPGDGLAAMDLKDEHAELSKLVSTFTGKLNGHALKYDDGRIRTDIRQVGGDTGRMSSSNPNLQQIPSHGLGFEVRRAFVSEEGWTIIDADYSQMELVLMGHLSRDENLLKAYREGLDLHQMTADACGVARPAGKVINLGLIYEMGPRTLAQNLKVSSFEGKRIWTAWHAKYPRVRQYCNRMHAYARKHGFVRTITGRIRMIPQIDSNVPAIRAYGERQASNSPDQGSGVDILKLAMRNLYREWKERGVLFDYWTGEGKVKIPLSVHDEILLEARDDFKEEAKADLKRHMENVVELRAPLTAEVGEGPNWAFAKEIAA